MISIGERITQLRKTKDWSQDELAKMIDSSRVMIGKYERGDNLPSIEVIVKLAKAFGVSVDYLLGEERFGKYDKEAILRLQEIQDLDDNTRNTLFSIIDTFIRDAKARIAYQ